MAQLKFTVNGDIQLSRNLRIAAVQIADLSDFYKEAIEIVENRTDEIFKTAWKNVKKWPSRDSLSPVTERARAAWWWHYSASPNNPWVMRWTWRLQDDRTKVVTKNSWSLTFNAPYAWYHQEWIPNKLPQRAIIDLDNDTNQKIVKSLQWIINDVIWIFWNQV